MGDLALLLIAIALMIGIITVAFSLLAVALDVSANDIMYYVSKRKPKECKSCKHYRKTARYSGQGTCTFCGRSIEGDSYCNYYEQKIDWGEER